MREIVEYKGDKYEVDWQKEVVTGRAPVYVHLGFCKLRPSVLLALCSVAVVLILIIGNAKKPVSAAENSHTPQVQAEELSGNVSSTESMIESFERIGVLFPDSDKRLLTWDDIDNIDACTHYSDEDLLQFAINEIYMRHGYKFEMEKYASFYYQKRNYVGTKSMEEAASDFEACEEKNRDFLCNIMKERGYR